MNFFGHSLIFSLFLSSGFHVVLVNFNASLSLWYCKRDNHIPACNIDNVWALTEPSLLEDGLVVFSTTFLMLQAAIQLN